MDDNSMTKIDRVLDEVKAELEKATANNGPLNSPHEALGVIQEEFEEYKQEVYNYNIRKGHDTRQRQHDELIQVAAMAIRAITDTTGYL